MSTLPLIPTADAQRVIVWYQGRPITVAHLLADARRLGERLPPRRHQINLCNDRYLFLLGMIAATLKGQTLLLPASKAPEDLRQIRAQHPDSYALSDRTDNDAPPDQIHLDPRCWGQTDSTHRIDATPTAMPGAIPDVRSDLTLATLYTSGSTGTASAHRKLWGTMLHGAELTGRRLGLDRLPGAHIVATVPPQHMFGFETSVLLPLRWPLAVVSEQPLLPMDIAHALARVPGPRVLITTPLHLRYLMAETGDLPDLALVISATAPLDPALATAAETRWRAPVMEIFGATETGAIATRQPARNDIWELLPGITLDPRDARLWLDAEHYPAPHPLNDRLDILDDKHFRLLGRDADLIKIAGKRESLADLNHKLQSIAGVDDGVMFVPEQGENDRLVALVVAPTLSNGALLDALRQCMDPVFLPRPLLRVDALPRNDTGKLPRRALRALYERVWTPR